MKETNIRIYMTELSSLDTQRIFYHQGSVLLDDNDDFIAVRVHKKNYKTPKELLEYINFQVLVSSNDIILRELKKNGFCVSKSAPIQKCSSLHVSISAVNEQRIIEESVRRKVTKSYIVEEILNEKYNQKPVCAV